MGQKASVHGMKSSASPGQRPLDARSQINNSCTVRVAKASNTKAALTRGGSGSCAREPRRRKMRGAFSTFFSKVAARQILVREKRALRNIGRGVSESRAALEDETQAAEGRECYLRRLGICPLEERAAKRQQRQVTRSPKLELRCELLESTETEQSHRGTSMSAFCETDCESESMAINGQVADSTTWFSNKAPDLIKRVGSQEYQARMKFLQKLSYQKVWVPKALRPPSHQTLIIFDWDDTLVCSTYLNYKYPRTGVLSMPLHEQRVLKAIEAANAKLLELALSLGQTFIITNALGGWVQNSARAWVPSLVPLLQKVHVVSARSRYEADYPHDVSKWKSEMFLEVRRQLDSQVITNLIALGDSEYEMEAAQTMGKEFRNATLKLVKFAQHPSPEELLKQLEIVIEEFEGIVGNAQNLRLRLQRPDSEPN